MIRKDAKPRTLAQIDGEPTDMFVFFCKGESFISRLILRVSKWSHCGIGFSGKSDAGVMPWVVYFESLFGKGFRGPYNIADLYAWAAKDPRRKVEIVSLGVSQDMAHEKYVRATTLVGKLGYAEWQLLAMWWFERVGRRFGWHVPRSPEKAVCSESVARILFPEIDLRDPIHDRLDEITPGSLYDALMKWVRERSQLSSDFAKATSDMGVRSQRMEGEI